MVTGINQNGNTVGIYIDTAGTTHGFTDIGGTFMTVDQPGTVFNQGLGINNSDTTVGYSSATDPMGMVGQTAYSQSGGVFSNINALLPSNQNSQAVGINNAGSIVGFYMPTMTTSIGFIDQGGTITTIDPFGSTFTQALGINNLGEVVGFYDDGMGVQHGYIDAGGSFTSFDPAGSASTTINGLNDLGQIVGFYTDANDNVIGFVGTPSPEPGTFGLAGRRFPRWFGSFPADLAIKIVIVCPVTRGRLSPRRMEGLTRNYEAFTRREPACNTRVHVFCA